MPIINSARRIRPLDLNKNIRIGVAFPLNETNLFSGTKTIKDQVKANLLNLLLTYPGERVNLPNFGIGIKNLIFEQKIDLESLRKSIQNQINIFIPNIKLQNVKISESEDKHTIIIMLSYNYLLDNTEDAIQLNFN